MVDEAYIMRRHTQLRVARCVMYFCLFLTGLLVVLYPPSLVVDQLGMTWCMVWAVCLIVSSLGCLVGSFTDRWLGEYTFLPLLFSVLFLYGLSVILAADGQSLPLFGCGALITAFASGLVARWQDVRDIKVASGDEYQKKE